MRFMIVAEVSCNHFGSVEYAKSYVEVAKACQADAVKFQFYSAQDIVDFEKRRVAEGLMSYYTEEMFKAIKKTEFTIDQLGDVRDYCKTLGIKFGVTPFIKPDFIDYLERISPDFYKVRERDSENFGLIDRCLHTGKRVFISTTKLPLESSYLYHPNIKWLFCVAPKYPTPFEMVELYRIENFDGLSDHTLGLTVSISAMGIAVATNKSFFAVEKHLTLHHDIDNLDKEVSIDPEEMRSLVWNARILEKMPIDRTAAATVF